MELRFQAAISSRLNRCKGEQIEPTFDYLHHYLLRGPFGRAGCIFVYWQNSKELEAPINRRLVLAKQGASAQEVFETLKRERGLIGLDNQHFAHLNDLIIQTGLRLDEKLLVFIAFSLGLLFFVLFGFAFGYGLLAFICFGNIRRAFNGAFPYILRKKRIAKFSEQLPDAIDVIVRGVKSGYPFTVALGLVSKEMADPIGTEFGMTSDEIISSAELGLAIHLLSRLALLQKRCPIRLEQNSA